MIRMEGRGQARAARHARRDSSPRRCERAGLQPAGDSGFFQRVPVAVVTQTRTLGNGTVVTHVPVLYRRFAALDTVPAERRRTAVNVVGILRGSDPGAARLGRFSSTRTTITSASGTPVNGDSIYNGADDDASGVVAVLEIARALAAGPPPRRTVIFAATTGEEVGLLGTRWYLEHPVVPLDAMTREPRDRDDRPA